MNAGKYFEQEFKDSIPNSADYYYLRIQDSANSFNQQAGGILRFSLKQPYDCLIYKHPTLYCFELKSTQGTSVTLQYNKKESGRNIQIHQINGLMKARNHTGIYAGFILNFRKTNNTYWLHIDDFVKFYNSTNKKSINENDIVQYGGILLDQTLKRIRYVYDISKLLNDIKKREG